MRDPVRHHDDRDGRHTLDCQARTLRTTAADGGPPFVIEYFASYVEAVMAWRQLTTGGRCLGRRAPDGVKAAIGVERLRGSFLVGPTR